MRDYSKFYTPPQVAKHMAELLNPQEGDVILEPSAGDGALVKAVLSIQPKARVFAFEINEAHRQHLKQAGALVVVIKDFLEIPVVAKCSSCIANPPFGNDTNLVHHFEMIRLHVKEGGKIVMIVPKEFDPYTKHETHAIENWSKNSDGSTTPIKIIEFIN